MTDRKEMIRDIWNSIDRSVIRLHRFSDGTDCYFLRHLKIEREGEKYNLYNTMTDMYSPIPDSAVWYAHNNGINKLSKVLSRTRAEHRLTFVAYQQTEETINAYKKEVKHCIDSNIPNLNLIKENYEQQRENS